MQHGRVVRGHLLRRYKRFLADVLVGDGPPSTDVLAAAASTTVHCPNTGPMIGLLDRAEAPVVLSVHEGTKRKYVHTLEMIQPEEDGSWVGVHSALANKMALSLLQAKRLVSLLPYNSVTTEVTVAEHINSSTRKRSFKECQSRAKKAKSRLDFQLERDDGLTFVEVSDRAQRHMKELIDLVHSGHKAVCLFIVQRSDCDAFAPSHAKDPDYAKLVQDAQVAGVQVIALACEPCPDGSFKYIGELPLDIAWSE